MDHGNIRFALPVEQYVCGSETLAVVLQRGLGWVTCTAQVRNTNALVYMQCLQLAVVSQTVDKGSRSLKLYEPHTHHSLLQGPPRWPSGKASASRAEDPGFESRLRRDFFGVESYQ